MESWSHDSEEKSHFFPENIDLQVTGLTQTRKVLTEWSINPHSLDNNMLVPEMFSKSLPSTANFRILGGENGSFSRKVPSFSPVTPNSFLGELESNSRLSSSLIKSDTQKSSINDLKLGNLVDWRETEKGKFSNEMSVISSVGSSFPSKRSRMTNMNSQSPVCQVLGCNKDLSSSKDYHKRHKVCDAHSKTSKVIVNGIEQRFCQQCSRFHLLAEFDDGKRSCRKRLAGHNERRRKLQLDTHFGKPQKLLHYYQSTSFLGTSLPKRTSFAFPDIQPSNSFSPQRYDQANQRRHIELDEEPNSPQLTMPVTDRQSLPKPFLHLHGVGQQNPSRMFSMENDYTALDTAPTVKKSSGVTNSRCALSLLSAQSQNLSSCSTGFFLASPLSTHGAHDQGSMIQNSNKSLGANNLEKLLPSGCYSSGLNSVEVDRVGPSMIIGGGDSVDFGTHRDGIFQRLNSMNSHFCVSPGNGHMVDLRQLSSHLQRVEEQQRNSVLVKKENCFQTT